jgi:multiple sugar transport system permease protein
MIIFLAGLQTVPSSLYESAVIDGANNWKKFWHITFPLLHPTTFFVSIMCIISSFRVFTPIYMMTQGGPGRATSVLVYRIYVETFENYHYGYASAISLVLFMCVFIVTLIQFKFQKKLIDY